MWKKITAIYLRTIFILKKLAFWILFLLLLFYLVFFYSEPQKWKLTAVLVVACPSLYFAVKKVMEGYEWESEKLDKETSYNYNYYYFFGYFIPFIVYTIWYQEHVDRSFFLLFLPVWFYVCFLMKRFFLKLKYHFFGSKKLSSILFDYYKKVKK